MKASALHELQAWMLDAICETAPPASAAIVTDGPRLSGRERLEIYRHAYTARLTECLRDDYPVLAATLGEDRFEALCREYIALHPSRCPNLNAFGRHMASLCASTNALCHERFWAELAALEWALVEVTHAETPVPLDPNELQQIPADAWAGARLIGSQALRVLSFEYPINAHFQAYRGEGTLLPPPAARPSTTAVYRHDVTLWRMDLPAAMAPVLRALLAGEPIGGALAQLQVDAQDAGALADAQQRLMKSFRDWVANGFFIRVQT